MPTLPYPVIVVPGITATYLRDLYNLPSELIWTVLTKDYARATLHPNNLRYELKGPARVLPDQVYEVAYQELLAELRSGLSPRSDYPVPVFPFGYDWRKPLVEIEASLKDFIEEVIDRTRLLRHYHDSGYNNNPMVNLVGHSMGGLVIAGYLQNLGGRAPVHKVATLASPFRGSQEAVLKIAVGTADLGGSDASGRDREAARLTPSLYHLLPSYQGALVDPAGVPRPGTLFDPASWQPAVVKTLTDFLTVNGLNPSSAGPDAVQLFRSLLSNAATHRQRLESLSLPGIGFDLNKWLCVVGVNTMTRVRMKVDTSKGEPVFDLSNPANDPDRLDSWGDATKDQADTGDGTVPFRGALSNFIPPEKLVCVTPDDYGYWEVQDRLMTKVGGFHGILPNMDMLHRLIVRFFTDAPDKYGNTWGRPAPGVTAATWAPPLPLTRANP